MDEYSISPIGDYDRKDSLDLSEGLSELARRLETERKHLEEQLCILSDEKQELAEKVEAGEQGMFEQTEEYRRHLKELNAQQERERRKFELQIEKLEDEKNARMIEMVNKEGVIKNEYEKKINKMGMEIVSLEEELKKVQLREEEERGRWEKEQRASSVLIKNMEERLRTKEEEKKEMSEAYENKLRKLEDIILQDRHSVKKKLHSRDSEIQSLKVEIAKLETQLNLEYQQRAREAERIKRETMNHALKELEKRLIAEREDWRDKLYGDNGN